MSARDFGETQTKESSLCLESVTDSNSQIVSLPLQRQSDSFLSSMWKSDVYLHKCRDHLLHLAIGQST